MNSPPPESLVELRPPLNSAGAVTDTSSSGRSTGSEFSKIWWRREKIAVLAPMPSPTERITTRLSSGAFARLRQAKRSRAISFLYTPRRAKCDLFFYEKRHRHPKSDGNDDAPNRCAPDFTRRTRSADSAQDGRHGHDQNVRPVHHAGPDEIGRRHSVDGPAEHHL